MLGGTEGFEQNEERERDRLLTRHQILPRHDGPCGHRLRQPRSDVLFPLHSRRLQPVEAETGHYGREPGLRRSTRAAFLLREVFDRDYDEIADTLDTTPAAARQLVHRAKSRIAEGRPRFTASPEGQREIVATFFAAVQKGDLTGLERYLAADVTYSADGGGKVAAARKPVHGAASVARLMHALVHKAAVATDATPGAWTTDLGGMNGETALLVYHRGSLDTVLVFSTEDGQITAIHAIRNPDKLAWLKLHGANRPS